MRPRDIRFHVPRKKSAAQFHSCAVRLHLSTVQSDAWTPQPVQSLHLQTSYNQQLRELLQTNFNKIQSQFPDCTSSDDIQRHLLTRASPEYRQVRKLRSQASKLTCSAGIYNEFLRKLYVTPGMKPDLNGLCKILKKFPSPFPRYIRSEHLENLLSIAQLHGEGKVYLFIFDHILAAGLPVTSRERAKYLQVLAYNSSSGGILGIFDNWRSHFNDCRDIGTMNTLLDVALKTGSLTLLHYLWDIKRSNGIVDDRFTKLVQMKYCHQSSEIFQHLTSFRNEFYTIDISTLYMVIRALLRHNHFDGAHALLSEAESSHPRTKTVNGDSAKCANLLRAIDTIARLTQTNQQVPLCPDESIYVLFYDHYLRKGQHNRAIRLLAQMADRDCFVNRGMLYKLLRRCNDDDRRRLGSFLQTVKDTKPGYVSPPLGLLLENHKNR